MKTLILSMALLFIVSCTKEEDDCNCTKNVMESISYTYNVGGLPRLGVRNEFRYSENAGCQDEVNFVNMGNGYFYEITCE